MNTGVSYLQTLEWCRNSLWNKQGCLNFLNTKVSPIYKSISSCNLPLYIVFILLLLPLFVYNMYSMLTTSHHFPLLCPGYSTLLPDSFLKLFSCVLPRCWYITKGSHPWEQGIWRLLSGANCSHGFSNSCPLGTICWHNRVVLVWTSVCSTLVKCVSSGIHQFRLDSSWCKDSSKFLLHPRFSTNLEQGESFLVLLGRAMSLITV